MKKLIILVSFIFLSLSCYSQPENFGVVVGYDIALEGFTGGLLFGEDNFLGTFLYTDFEEGYGLGIDLDYKVVNWGRSGFALGAGGMRSWMDEDSIQDGYAVFGTASYFFANFFMLSYSYGAQEYYGTYPSDLRGYHRVKLTILMGGEF